MKRCIVAILLHTKAKHNEIKEERELTEDGMAKIITEMLIESEH